MVEAHMRGRGDHSRKLFTLMVLEMWLRRWTAPAAKAPTKPAWAAPHSQDPVPLAPLRG
jgi:hypothetical protein